MPSVLHYVVDILGTAFCPWQCFLSFIVLLTSLAQHFALHYITDMSLALLVLHFVIYVLGTVICPFSFVTPVLEALLQVLHEGAGEAGGSLASLPRFLLCPLDHVQVP